MADKEDRIIELLEAMLFEMQATTRHFRVIAKQIACHNAAEIPEILRRIDANTRTRDLD
jgi:hypothetical protein